MMASTIMLFDHDRLLTVLVIRNFPRPQLRPQGLDDGHGVIPFCNNLSVPYSNCPHPLLRRA